MYGENQTDIIAMLKFEHRLMERAVDSLEHKLAGKPEAGEVVAFTELINFFMGYADQVHQEKEEHVVFEVADAMELPEELEELMEDLRKEHHQFTAGFTRMAELNRQLAAGKKSAREELKKALADLKPIIQEHIEEEENEFYPGFVKLQKKKDQKEIILRMQRFDAEAIHSGYEGLLERNE